MQPSANQFLEISAERKVQILQAWNEAIARAIPNLINVDELSKLVAKHWDPSNINVVEPIPGCIALESAEALYVVYEALTDGRSAREIVLHEMQHGEVYNRHGVPCVYGVIIGLRDKAKYRIMPFVSPEFPAKMPIETRLTIFREATMAVSDRSQGDLQTLMLFDKNDLR